MKVAKQAALEAGKVIQKYSGKVHVKNIKNEDTSNFATEVDTEAEKIIVKILTKNFPSHNIIAEEGSRSHKNSEYIWVIDPLDGTFGFSHGMPYFSVSIGLLKNNYPIIGVIYHISAKDLYFAQADKGAYLNGDSIHVSQGRSLESAALAIGFGSRKKRVEKSYIRLLIDKVGYPYSLGSAATKLALVAKGMFDAFVNEAWVWDFVAGAVIVREAGGRVTDFAGNEPDWSQERLNIVASNGLIHDQILEALRG